MPFPLLKCLRTHYGRHCEQLSDQKCTRLQVFFCMYNLKSFAGGHAVYHTVFHLSPQIIISESKRLCRTRQFCMTINNTVKVRT